MSALLGRFISLLLILAACTAGCSGVHRRSVDVVPRIHRQSSGTDALLIGLDVLTERVAWAAGTDGTYVWTIDGGETWHAGSVPDADTLQFRDVHAVRPDASYLLSIGPGAASRIYRTGDRGVTWALVFVNPLEHAFYDCFDFWEDGSGLAFSDAVDGSFPIVRTESGSEWELIRQQPAALPNEGGFAASGTCLVTLGGKTALIGTGNAETARVLRTEDGGTSWTSAETPIASGEAAGITTLAFRDARRGVALGGDLTRPDAVQQNAARTEDGGRTWRAAASPAFPGAVYGSTYVPGSNILVAVGPGGAAYSTDAAASWAPLDTLSYWSVDAAGLASVWAVGPEGRIARFDFTPAGP